jgi:hypothetical protein
VGKPCKVCSSVAHTAFRCPRKPRVAMKSNKGFRPGKRLRPVGKIGKALHDQRIQFLAEHEPPYMCIYCLVIGIENFLVPEDVNVEHGESKARHPDKRFTKKNLYISCGYHNQDKSSMDIDEYIALLLERKREYERQMGSR